MCTSCNAGAVHFITNTFYSTGPCRAHGAVNFATSASADPSVFSMCVPADATGQITQTICTKMGTSSPAQHGEHFWKVGGQLRVAYSQCRASKVVVTTSCNASASSPCYAFQMDQIGSANVNGAHTAACETPGPNGQLPTHSGTSKKSVELIALCIITVLSMTTGTGWLSTCPSGFSLMYNPWHLVAPGCCTTTIPESFTFMSSVGLPDEYSSPGKFCTKYANDF